MLSESISAWLRMHYQTMRNILLFHHTRRIVNESAEKLMGDFSSPLLCSPLSVSHSLKLTKQMETQDERKSQAYGNDLRQDDFNENI